MCLFLDKDYHGNTNEPFVARRDIVVYKALERTRHNQYKAPYRDTPWSLDVLTKSAKIRPKKYHGHAAPEGRWIADRFIVHVGLHAYTKRTTCVGTFRGWRGIKILYAVIPKGATVYWGTLDEVVSNKMIVYSSLNALQKVHGKVAEPVLKKNLSRRQRKTIK